ncbi:cyclin-domain-containing protein [Cylindrobasidium torrendii FP15055 ss-10]|uniref:Cyclin-domain-containing protein n=1 Tax=Cylindrobasidium torrendii FP15055 ss-10 TaxID=1314674 RepID=A0A0D7B566_9AGAR|nr:cyclin-domain-containing protein [Cylindrobasidium torrendii FP15055 ss-10]
MESSSASDPRVEVPASFEDASMDTLVDLIADMLQRLMSHNDLIPLSPQALTRFHSRSAPGISVLDYLKRIVKFINVEKSCMLITLHYIDQICTNTPLFTLSSLTCHRFLITSICVSAKCLCDTFCTNALYAKVGGITVQELNILEREFLGMIDWHLLTTRDVLNEYYVNLARTHTSGKYVLDPEDASDIEESDYSYSSPSQRPIGIPPQGPSPRPTIEQNMAFAALQKQTSNSDG